MKKQTFKKGLLITVFSLVILVLSINTIVSFIIKNKINKAENVTVDDVSSNIFSGTINLHDLEISDLMIDSNQVLNGSVKEVQVNHIKIFQYLSDKTLATGLIEINESQLKLASTSDSLLINKFLSKSKTSNALSGVIESIVVRQSALVYDRDSGKVLNVWINNINTGELRFPIDKNSDHPITTSLSFQTDSIVYVDSVSMYTFSIYNLVSDKESKQISLELLDIHPHHNKNTFARRAKFQTDRFEGQVRNIIYNYKSADSLLTGKTIKGNISCDTLHLIAYRDKTIPRKEHDIKHTVQKYLSMLKFELDLDSMTIQHAEITYQEKSEQSGLEGEINFGSVNTTLTHITNVRKTDTLVLKASSTFMNTAKVIVDIQIPLSQNYFDCKGSITGLPFKNLNKITGSAAGIIFSRGNMKKIAFNMRADVDSSRGDLILEYDDLDFAVQNKPGGDTTGIKSKIITFIAGDIFLPTSIPGEGKVLKAGVISNPKNEERFMFNYIWKSIFSGLKSAVRENMQGQNTKKSKKEKSNFFKLF
ncbi:MAG TPA: hypothetical protein PKD91_07630 [Bacteroidia bacterium]|nr:hypothetical protein [Bacteroidia bacterium]